jgi:hypothetical protein
MSHPTLISIAVHADYHLETFSKWLKKFDFSNKKLTCHVFGRFLWSLDLCFPDYLLPRA